MANTYKKPETRIVKIETQQMCAGSPNPSIDPTQNTSTMDAKGFDFFSYEEEEEAPGKSDEDDSWEDWEEEE